MADSCFRLVGPHQRGVCLARFEGLDLYTVGRLEQLWFQNSNSTPFTSETLSYIPGFIYIVDTLIYRTYFPILNTICLCMSNQDTSLQDTSDTFFCPKADPIREVPLYCVPVCKYRWPLVLLWLVHTHQSGLLLLYREITIFIEYIYMYMQVVGRHLLVCCIHKSTSVLSWGCVIEGKQMVRICLYVHY